MLRQRVHEARVVERPVVGHRRGETRPPRRRRGRRYHCRERLLAVGADERRLTNTRVGVRGRRQTNAVVETWRGIARTTVRRREGNVTVQAAKTDRAKAQDQAGRAHARSAVETRRRGAQVHACVAHAARVARWTRARVATATATAARDASRSHNTYVLDLASTTTDNSPSQRQQVEIAIYLTNQPTLQPFVELSVNGYDAVSYSAPLSPNAPLANDTWQHVCLTRDSSGLMNAYVNGQLTNSQFKLEGSTIIPDQLIVFDVVNVLCGSWLTCASTQTAMVKPPASVAVFSETNGFSAGPIVK